MSLQSRWRNLFRARPRRRNVGPRVVELLEQRVLLTDVAYYDLLKGQNFAQTGTGNPTRQAGSPFHLHSSVHSPDGFTSAASVRLPNNTTKTLIEQGSTQYRALEQSFATKAALDSAYGTGNYSFTIQHPLDLNFSPPIDASAGVNLSPGSRTFNSQVFEPDLAGNFHEIWSPFTPNTLDADGTITSTSVTAILTGHVNRSVTGSVNATWNAAQQQYAGSYSFNGQTGDVTIPEGFITTLNLPEDAYPNAPHITNFTAAQTLNPAADFTLNWDTFEGGTADDLITLFIFDGNNQVFHTDAIPLPSDSSHLDGTATSFKLPKNTLLANKTYQGQLWFTNFATIDTTSFPRAKGTTGHYIATNFTIRTGTAVDSTPPDVVAYYVSKAQEFLQEDASAPRLNTEDFPFVFLAHIEERETVEGTVLGATVKIAGVVEDPPELFQDGNGGWDFIEELETKSELDTLFKAGKYTFAIDTFHQGLKSPAVTLPSDAYPVTPHISNWADAQLIDATADFTLTWDAFTGGTKDDFIQLLIGDDSGDLVFETPPFWEANPLQGTARSVVIPAGTFIAGDLQTARLLFANASTLDRTSYKNAIGTTTYAKLTTFTVSTLPSEGLLQFDTANYSVSETSGTATIRVTRIGGSEGEVTVDYSMTDGSATDISDYTIVTGTLTFADGESSQTFEIPILDDAESEGHETVSLLLNNPNGGAGLASRVTAMLTILDDELTFGPGNFIDSDGDKYTIKLTGPSTARITLDDSDGDGKGSVKAIILTDTTSATSLSLTVTKATTGDGEVSIGRVVVTGALKSFSAAKSDLIGSGFNVTGLVGQMTFDDVLNGADITVGGTALTTAKMTLGDVAGGSELRSGAALSTLATQSFRGDLIQAPAIGTLSTATGPMLADLQLGGAIKSLTVKGGAASGDWTASNFGTVSITGGGFTGTLRATATAEQLKTTPSVSTLSITGGDLTGLLSGLAAFSTLLVKKDSAGNGGSVLDTTLSAKSFGTVTIGKNLIRSQLLAGASLGLDQVIGGIGINADTFGTGSVGTLTVGGFVDAGVVGAGLDPFGENFHNGNDEVIGGKNSPLKSLTITGGASADSYLRAGLLPASVKIAGVVLNPLIDSRFNDLSGVADAAETDEDGNVTLNLAGQPVQFRIIDDASGQGVPGLIVGVTTATGTDGLALMEILDPTDQFPIRLLVLHGTPEGTPPADEPETPGTTVVGIGNNAVKTIKALHLPNDLPKLKPVVKASKILEGLGHLIKFSDQAFGGRLSRAAADVGLFTRPTRILRGDALQRIDAAEAASTQKNLAFLTISLIVAPQATPASITAAGTSYALNQTVSYFDRRMVENLEGDLYVTRLWNTDFYFVVPADPGISAPLTPFVPDEENRPDGTEFISKTRPGTGFEIIFGDGPEPVPIPADDYDIVQIIPGRPPVHSTITVPPGGTIVPLGVPRPAVASLQLIATPRPTGFLDPGSQIKLTLIAKDAADNVIPDNQLDLDCLTPQVFNPGDSTVGSLDAPRFAIDPDTGKATAVLTIGDASGAARISAVTCHGVTSNAVLISGLSFVTFNLPIVSLGDDFEVVEGPKGTTKLAKFPLTLNKPSDQRIIVPFNSQFAGASGDPATATAGVDYQQKVGSVTFEPGQTAKTIDITVIGDDITELDEQFLVGLLASLNMNFRYALRITARCTISDDDQPDVLVIPTSGLVTMESGGTATFTIKLKTQPTADVTVNLSSDDTTEGTVIPASVTFTPANWNTAKTVTAKGVNDTLIDGDIVYHIVTSAAISADPNYNGKNPTDVTVTNRDNDQPTSLTGTFKGSWSRPVFGFGDEVSELTWVLTQSGSSVSGTFTKRILDSPIFSDIGQTVTGRLINGQISGSTLTIETDGGTPFSGTFTLLHLEGLGGSGTRRGPFALDRVGT